MVMMIGLAFLWYGFLIGGSFLVLALLHRLIEWVTSPLRTFPGPKGRCLPLGNFPEMLRGPKYVPFTRWWKEAGHDSPLLHFTIVFWRQHLLILDKEIVKTILTSPYGKEPLRFTRRTQALQDSIGNGLVTVQGLEWTRHRRILQPAFNTRFLKESMAAAVPHRVQRFIQAWKPGAENGWEIDLAPHIAALTLDIVGDVAFSHSFNALDTLEAWSKEKEKNANNKDLSLSDVGDTLLTYFSKLVGLNIVTVVCIVLNVAQLNWYVNPQLRAARKFLDGEVDKVVAQARKDNTKERSLLHLLLHARDPEIEGEMGQLSDSDLRDEVKTFMIAGHETTSTWLHWGLYALVKHPDVQERLYEEVIKYSSTDQSLDVTIEQTEQMEFLGAFLQEVLRMYPPVGTLIRYNAFEEKWHGVTIPRDTRLFMVPHLMHRHPKYWDDPETFMPERWINVSAKEAERRRFAFIPFSAGGRNCKFLRSVNFVTQYHVLTMLPHFLTLETI